MNKKFSTLVAVLLAAGAWTTLDAAIAVTAASQIKETGAYLIGSDENPSDGSYDVLLQTTDAMGSGNEVKVEKGTATWTLTKDEEKNVYTLAAGGKTLCATNTDGAGLNLTLGTAGSSDLVAVQFAIDGEKLKLVNHSELSTNTAVEAGQFLSFGKGTQAVLAKEGTDLVFGKYEDDPVAPVVPGQGGLKVGDDGIVTDLSGLAADATIDAPLYFSFADQYLTASADGKVALLDKNVVPEAEQSLEASWRWSKGRLISVAAERAGETKMYLQIAAKGRTAVDLNTADFALVAANAATTFTAANGDLTVSSTGAFSGQTIATVAKVSPVLTVANIADNIDVTIAASQSKLADASNLSVYESLPGSEYVLVVATKADGSKEYLKSTGDYTAEFAAVINISDANYKNYLWKVGRSGSGTAAYKYTFTNMATEKDWQTNGNNGFITASEVAKGFALKDAAGNDVMTSTSNSELANIAFYESPIAAKSKTELDKILNPGFGVTIALKKDDKTAIKGIEVFGKTLYPLTVSGNTIQIVDKLNDAKTAAAADANYLVLDKAGWDGTKLEKTKGEFIWVSKDDFNDTNKNKNWLSNFQVRYRSGMPSTYEMETLAVMNANGTLFGNAYVMSVEKTNYLVTKESLDEGEVWPYFSLNLPNIVNVKDLLGKYWNISFAETNVSDNEEYKLNGVLAVAYDADANYIPAGATKITGVDVAEYVKGSTVLKSSPESQWAVVSANLDDNSFVLQNRENPNVRIKNVTLRKTGDIYTIVAATAVYGTAANAPTVSAAPVLAGDQVYLESVKDHTKFDGFRTATVNELRNQVFHIGQYHNGTGNSTGLWAENHQSNASHQLGVVAGEDKEAQAVKWRLRLDNKFKSGEEIAEVDTIFVVTEFATLNAKGDGFVGSDKATKDTLAILPYQFQNKANLEYVIFNNKQNQNYFACDEKADKEESAVRFALKAKPNDTYNIVVLGGTGASKTTTLGDKKVYVGNSDQWGSIKKYNTYAADNNSLMQVIQIDKPEYRKVVKEWGDTIRIYREEYPTEVLFEKRDDKSVVDKDTLSFLNVNNSITGANPALFVDTAYVNRVDKEGIANTCYQYLLAVNVDKENSFFCPYNPEHNTAEWRKEHNGPCADALENRAVKGRFLINLVDTAFAYKQDHLHNNPYVNNVEAYEHLAKLSFVEGIHANDTLYITRKGGEVVKLAMDTTAFNVAKFAFRYVDNEAGSFKIQTQFKDYTKTTKKEFEKSANDNGYLRWVNGTIVVTDSYLNGETFNMEEGFAGDPTANENAPEVSSISVVAGNGSVTIKGAAGKTVSIANVLGQTIANTVLSSDEATIAAPAGVVVVAVEGEAAVKAIVK